MEAAVDDMPALPGQTFRLPTAATYDRLTPWQRRAMVGAIVAVHVAAFWALLQVREVREAVAEVAPVFVSLVTAATPPKVTPPPPPPPPPARFEKVTLSASELFGFDSATLHMPQPKLDDIAAALQADPSITDVDITGYTDRLGSPKYNQKLSERRANAVRDYLIGKGVAANRLKAYGKGEKNPVVTDCHQKKRKELIECLAPNRRVEVEPITIERRVQ